jgi:hypothetical protein
LTEARAPVVSRVLSKGRISARVDPIGLPFDPERV